MSTPSPATAPSRRSRAVGLTAAALALGMLGSGFLVWQGSEAAFSSTTSNPGNSWTAGSVELSDNDSGTALFDVDALVPGSTGTRCILVTYSGTVASDVRFHVTDVTTTGADLSPYLDLTVTPGTGTPPVGSPASCDNFVADGTAYGPTAVADLPGTWATGVLGWTPSSAATRAYQVTYTFDTTGADAATVNALQGGRLTAALTWTAQSTA